MRRNKEATPPDVAVDRRTREASPRLSQPPGSPVGVVNSRKGIFLAGANGKFAGSQRLPRAEPAPGTLKRCCNCHEDKPIEMFGRNKATHDFHDYRCHDCRAAREKTRYSLRRNAAAHRRWKRMRNDTLFAVVEELLQAATAAKTAGMWRGRPAIQAYGRLCAAIAGCHRDGAQEEDVVDDTPAPPESAPASDADWDKRRHGTQRWLIGRSLQ